MIDYWCQLGIGFGYLCIGCKWSGYSYFDIDRWINGVYLFGFIIISRCYRITRIWFQNQLKFTLPSLSITNLEPLFLIKWKRCFQIFLVDFLVCVFHNLLMLKSREIILYRPSHFMIWTRILYQYARTRLGGRIKTFPPGQNAISSTSCGFIHFKRLIGIRQLNIIVHSWS